MARSSKAFSRWKAHEPTTWPFQMFLSHNQELSELNTAHFAARKFVYSPLGRQGAKWTDTPSDALGKTDKYLSLFKDLQAWSQSYNVFENWVNLSSTLTVASNLETYLAAVIALSLESDSGLLIGSPRAVDGGRLLKSPPRTALDITSHIEACTKGDWSKRLSSSERLFGLLPKSITDHHAAPERLRNIRNRFGHAFGRDIEEARQHGSRTIKPMEILSPEQANKIKGHATRFAREIDRLLLSAHIGDYEVLSFYSKNMKSIPNAPIGMQANALKKAIGGIGAVPRGKTYCRGLLDYWNGL